MLGRLPDAGRSALLVQTARQHERLRPFTTCWPNSARPAPRTRVERAEAFAYKHGQWLQTLPAADGGHAQGDGTAICQRGHRTVWKSANLSNSRRAQGRGLDALKILGRPVDILRETKGRMFAGMTATAEISREVAEEKPRLPDGWRWGKTWRSMRIHKEVSALTNRRYNF